MVQLPQMFLLFNLFSMLKLAAGVLWPLDAQFMVRSLVLELTERIQSSEAVVVLANSSPQQHNRTNTVMHNESIKPAC